MFKPFPGKRSSLAKPPLGGLSLGGLSLGGLSLGGLSLALSLLAAACAAPSLNGQAFRALDLDLKSDSAVTIRKVTLGPDGRATVDFEASEAILALTNPTPNALSVRATFEGAGPTEASRQLASLAPASSLAECGLPSVERFKGFKPRPAGLPRMAAPRPPLGETMAFVVGIDVDQKEDVPAATLVYEGQHCLIYLDDRDAASLSPQRAKELGEIFDNRTYPRLSGPTGLMGAEPPLPDSEFNFGQEKVIFLFTQALSNGMPGAAGMVDPADFFHPDLVEPQGLYANYAKMIYMLPDYADSPAIAGTMAHEFVHVLFDMLRIASYGEHHPADESLRGLPYSYNPSYLMDGAAFFAELGINEGLAELGKFHAGYSPDELAMNVERIALFLGQPQRYNLLEFRGPGYELGNYGGMSLISSYMHGRNPNFAHALPRSQATGSAAIAEALGEGKGFPELYRDFTLAMVLDGMTSAIPARYQIPFVDLHKTYDLGSGLMPLRGANDSTSPVVPNGPRPYGVRYTRVAFPNGKGTLHLSGQAGLEANLILLKPGAGFEEI